MIDQFTKTHSWGMAAIGMGVISIGASGMDPPMESDHVAWVMIAQEAPPPSTANDEEKIPKTTPTPIPDDVPFVEITVEGNERRIRSNGLPNHPTGTFPNRGNPGRITAQTYDFRIPVEPVITKNPIPVGMEMFGVALSGCFFEAGTAEWWKNDRNSGWHIEAIGPRGGLLGIDFTNGHVQPSGGYHYHAVPEGLIETLIGKKVPEHPVLIGWAADGLPIYGPWGYADANDSASPIKKLLPSWQLKSGERTSLPDGPGGRYDGTYEEDHEFVEDSGDLDRLNGRFGITPEFPQGTYYYVVTDSFPFISRYWKGEPSPGMSKRNGRSARPGRGEGRGQGRSNGSGRGRGQGRGRGGREGGRPPGRPTPPPRLN